MGRSKSTPKRNGSFAASKGKQQQQQRYEDSVFLCNRYHEYDDNSDDDESGNDNNYNHDVDNNIEIINDENFAKDKKHHDIDDDANTIPATSGVTATKDSIRVNEIDNGNNAVLDQDINTTTEKNPKLEIEIIKNYHRKIKVRNILRIIDLIDNDEDNDSDAMMVEEKNHNRNQTMGIDENDNNDVAHLLKTFYLQDTYLDLGGLLSNNHCYPNNEAHDPTKTPQKCYKEKECCNQECSYWVQSCTAVRNLLQQFVFQEEKQQQQQQQNIMSLENAIGISLEQRLIRIRLRQRYVENDDNDDNDEVTKNDGTVINSSPTSVFDMKIPKTCYTVLMELFLTERAYQICNSYVSINDVDRDNLIQRIVRDFFFPSEEDIDNAKGEKEKDNYEIPAKIFYKAVDNKHSHWFDELPKNDHATSVHAHSSSDNNNKENKQLGSIHNISHVDGNIGVSPSLTGKTDTIAPAFNTSTTTKHTVEKKIPGLVPTLRKYQEGAVRWMLQREKGNYRDNAWEICWVVKMAVSNANANESTNHETSVLPLYKWKQKQQLLLQPIVKNASTTFFYNPYMGWLVNSYDAAMKATLGEYYSPVRGGILAESMGLGKTVEVLACILSNPYQKEETNNISSNKKDDNVFDNLEQNIYNSGIKDINIKSNITVNEYNSDDDDYICFCGRGYVNRYKTDYCSIKNSLSWVLCNRCGEPMHGLCAGFETEKDILLKSKLVLGSQNKRSIRVCHESRCPICVTAQHYGRNKLIDSRATLIIAPPSILSQWENEIRRHTTAIAATGQQQPTMQSLKVKVYSGVKELCNISHIQAKKGMQRRLINSHYLADADIVLTTFSVLMQDFSHSDDNPYVSSSNGRGRKRKRYRVLPSPLINIRWWRVCLDEAQRVERPISASARMALKLVSQHRWCITGTPIGKGKMKDIHGLILFLNSQPFCSKDWFQYFCNKRDNFDDIDRISHMFQDILWRSTKSNNAVRLQMGIPEQTEKKTLLKFSSVERHFYARQLDETAFAASAVIGKKENRKIKDIDVLSRQLHRLRAACCHPQVGTSGIGKIVSMKSSQSAAAAGGGTSVANGVLTMSQILDRLIDDSRSKAEEAQRLYTLNTNALACLYKLKAEALDDKKNIVDNQEELTLLRKSCNQYLDAIEISNKNATPTPVVGEAIVNGCSGFQCHPDTIARDGVAVLGWVVHQQEDGDSTKYPEVWSRFDFNTTKKINSLSVRPLIRRPKQFEGSSQKRRIMYPRECVLQVSNAAIGGMFVDAFPFILPRPTTVSSSPEWQQVEGGFRPQKSRNWRILIKNFHDGDNVVNNNNAKCVNGEMHISFVGIEIQMMEPGIVPDSLQRLHILHNAELILSVLQQQKLNQGNNKNVSIGIDEDGDDQDNDNNRFSIENIEETIRNMRKEKKGLESHYIQAARVLQIASQTRLRQATKRRTDILEKLQSFVDKKKQGTGTLTAVNITNDCPWWQGLLAWCSFQSKQVVQASLLDHVETCLVELDHDPSQPRSGRSFPKVNTLDGLNLALSMRLEKNTFFPKLFWGKSLSENQLFACLKEISDLSDDPSDGEIFENSRCHKCRSDWDQKGPKCKCCKLEEKLLEHDKCVRDPEINCILKSIFQFLKQSLVNKRPRKKSSSTTVSALQFIERMADTFFELKNAVLKELDCAKTKWRTHLDLLGDFDELNQCKRTLRLAYLDENLFGLSTHEQAFIVQPHDIGALLLDHTAKQAMAEGSLRRSKEILRFLKNQNLERKQQKKDGYDDGIGATCSICLSSLKNNKAVLRCGHAFHHSPCLERLFARAGFSHTITCPFRCPIKTKREDVLIASEFRKDDGSKARSNIKGCWGTKVDNLISDLIGVVQISEKSIVFSQWDDMLTIMEHALQANQIQYVRPKYMSKIGDSLKLFLHTGNCHVLLLNIKHGAEGLTLVEANHIFMIEPLLNHSIDSQAINRIHRIGQTSKTYIHRYIIEDTIEVKIDKLRAERQRSHDEGEEGPIDKNWRHGILQAGGVDGVFVEDELQDLLEQ